MSQLNVDNIQNRTGSNGGPNFPSGISVAVGQTAYIHGNLQVDGTETIINTETLNVADKTVGIGSTSNASNTTADGSGIEVFASSSQTGNNKTLTWGNTANSWEFGPNDVGLKVGTGVTVYGGTGIVSATSFKGDGSLLTGIDATAIQTGNTSVQTVDTGSDGHVKMTTEGGERVRVGPAGQIGLGGANYGTSGQVITSAGTGAAPTWSAIPAGGNQIDLVADGAIATNKPVIITTAGKAAEVKQTDTLITTLQQASQQKYADASGNQVRENSNRIAYDPDDNIILTTYVNNNSPEYPQCRLQVPAAAGGDFTSIGGLVTITSHSGGSNGDQNVTYLSSRRFVYVYSRADTAQARIAVGTVSGSGTARSISWNADQSLDGNTSCNYSAFQIVKLGADRVAVFCTARNGNCRWTDDRPGVIIVDFSGSTATYRNFAQLSTDISNSNWWGTSLAYNSTDDLCFATWYRSSSIINSRAFKVDSGTAATITLGAEAGASVSNDYQSMVWHPTQNKFLLVFKYTNGVMTAIIYTVNSSTLAITDTSPAVISGSSGKGHKGLFLVVTAQNTIHLKCIDTNRNAYTYVDNSFNGTAFNPDVEGNAGNSANGYLSDAVRSISVSQSPTQDVVSIYGTTTATTGKRPWAAVNKVVTATSNLVHQDHYIGFADQAYSDGQTATILTYGNNVNTLSGLTAGTKYYIQANGSLATTADGTLTGYFIGNTPIAGTALSATKLLIRDPTVRA